MPTCFLVSWACDACAHNTNCAPCHKPTVTWLSSQKEKVYVMMQEPENVFFFFRGYVFLSADTFYAHTPYTVVAGLVGNRPEDVIIVL